MNPASTGIAILKAASPMSRIIFSVGAAEKSGPPVGVIDPGWSIVRSAMAVAMRMPPHAIIGMT